MPAQIVQTETLNSTTSKTRRANNPIVNKQCVRNSNFAAGPMWSSFVHARTMASEIDRFGVSCSRAVSNNHIHTSSRRINHKPYFHLWPFGPFFLVVVVVFVWLTVWELEIWTKHQLSTRFYLSLLGDVQKVAKECDDAGKVRVQKNPSREDKTQFTSVDNLQMAKYDTKGTVLRRITCLSIRNDPFGFGGCLFGVRAWEQPMQL